MSEKTIYRKDIDRLFDEGLDLKRLNGKTILVVGATGLIGSCVVDVLMLNPDRGYRVVAAGRNRLRARTKFAAYWDEADFGFVEMDVTQPMDEQCEAHGLSAQGIDFVIDAASNASPNFFREKPVEVMKANFDGVAHLIEFGLQHGMKRMVYISSGEVYGEGDGSEFSETSSGYVDCASVRACYPSSKRAAETLCMAYGAEYGADVVIARLSHTYGPGFTESDNRVYAQFIRNVLRGEDIVLKSRGEAFRSWLYVVDAAHTNLQALQMLGGFLDLGNGFAQVVERTATTRTTDILGLAGTQTGSLENTESSLINGLGSDVAIVHQPDAVGQTVYHQGSHVGCGFQLEVALLLLAVLIHLCEDDRVLQSCIHHLVYQGTLVAKSVLVIAHADDYHLRMILQASDVFFGWSTKLQGEELDVSPNAGDERHSHGREDRIELGTRGLWFAVQGLVDIIIYDVALARHKLLRLLSTYIYIVGFGILIVASRALAIDTVADDYGNLISANIAYSLSLSAHRMEPVDLGASLARNQQLPLLLSDIIHQMAGYRNLCGRFLAQTYTHGIADTIGKQGTDTHSTLDSSVLAFTSLSNAQMQRIAHAFLLHLAD